MPDDALFGSQQVSIDGRRVLLGRSYANTHGNFSGDAVVFTVAQNGTCCPGDCDGSGTVDFNDLGAMLLEYDRFRRSCGGAVSLRAVFVARTSHSSGQIDKARPLCSNARLV